MKKQREMVLTRNEEKIMTLFKKQNIKEMKRKKIKILKFSFTLFYVVSGQLTTNWRKIGKVKI